MMIDVQHVPISVQNLAVERIGNAMRLTWTEPAGNTDLSEEYDLRLAAWQISEANFGAAIHIQGVPEPGPAGTLHEMFVPAVTHCASYHFAIKTRNGALWSAVSADRYASTECAAVSDLLVSPGVHAIAVSWTEPDQGQGEADVYDLRWSWAPFTEEAVWNLATPIATGAPGPGGTEHCVVVDELIESCRQHWVGIKSRGGETWTGISNVPTCTTDCQGSGVAACRPIPASDVSVPITGRTTACVSWTEPNQGGGAPQEVDLRYSNSMIAEGNFASATRVQPNPYPVAPTQVYYADVSGLQLCHQYYFAAKTKKGGVWSLISNVASAATQCSGPNAFCEGEGLWAGGGGEESAASSPLLESARGGVSQASAAQVPTGENTIVFGATGAGLIDLLALKGLTGPVASEYPVRLREMGSRKADVDHVALGVVDHDAGVSAFAGLDRAYLGATASVVRVTDQAGADLTAVLNGSGDESFAGRPGDYLLVELGKATASTGLVVESAGYSPRADLDSSGVLIQKPEKGGGWTTLAHHHPRKQYSEFATPARGSGALRLLFLGDHSIRSLRALAISETAVPQRLALARAIQSRVGSVADAIGSTGGATSNLLPGDTLTLAFTATAVPEGKVRDLFLLTTGAFAVSDSTAAPLATASQSAAVATQPVYELALGPARPNPSLGSVTIGYSLAQESPVSVRVYNVAGRLVRTLVSGTGEAGPHEVVWDARDDGGRAVPAGVYFYRMTAGSWQSQRKVVFLER